MGCRNIYIALVVTAIVIILMDFVFNEESQFCCLPETFTTYYTSKLENDTTGTLNMANSADKVTDEQIKHAEAILEKAKANNTQLQSQKFTPISY